LWQVFVWMTCDEPFGFLREALYLLISLPLLHQFPCITLEISKYLYSNLREHAWSPYEDITCPTPMNITSIFTVSYFQLWQRCSEYREFIRVGMTIFSFDRV
jgi:hypothetical protein